MVVMYIIGIIAGYIAVMGFSNQWHHGSVRRLRRDEIDFVSVIWPLTLPYFLTVHFVSICQRRPRRASVSKRDRSRAEEIAEAEHRLRLTEIRAREIQVAERNAGL